MGVNKGLLKCAVMSRHTVCDQKDPHRVNQLTHYSVITQSPPILWAGLYNCLKSIEDLKPQF